MMHRLALRVPALALMALIVCLFAPVACADELDTLEGLVHELAALRTEIADAQREWQAQDRQWRDEIGLLRREKEMLEAARAADAVTEDAMASNRVESLRRRDELTALRADLVPVVERAEAALRVWPAMLPLALRESLDASFAKLSLGARGDAARPLASRVQQVVGLYSEIEKLHNGMHAVTEIIRTADGARREVDVLYVGLSRGFAVSADTTWCAIGMPGAVSWIWEERPELAEDVRQAVNIVKRLESAALVPLPLQVAP